MDAIRRVVVAVSLMAIASVHVAVAQDSEPPDRLLTVHGERVLCKVLSVKDGAVEFQARWLTGPARARLSDLQRVCLGPRGAAAAGTPQPAQELMHRVELVNGDYFCGSIRSLDDENLGVVSPTMGHIRLDREAVVRILLLEPAHLLHSNDFQGPLQEWKAARGEWRTVDGRAEPTTPSTPRMREFSILQLPLQYAAPVTLVADVYRSNPCHLMVEVGLLLDSVDFKQVKHALSVRVEDSTLRAQQYSEFVGSRQLQRAGIMGLKDMFRLGRPTRLRVAVGEAGQDVVVWVNGEEKLRTRIPSPREQPREGLPTDRGACVLLRSVYGESFGRVRLYDGFFEPGKECVEPAEGDDVLVMKNGDRLVGRVVRLAEAEWTVEANGAELSVDHANLASMALDHDPDDGPEPPADALRVHTLYDGLTVHSLSMADGRLSGQLVRGGRVVLPRSSVRKLSRPSADSPAAGCVRAGTTPGEGGP